MNDDDALNLMMRLLSNPVVRNWLTDAYVEAQAARRKHKKRKNLVRKKPVKKRRNPVWTVANPSSKKSLS